MDFFDDIGDFFSGSSDEAVPDVASLIGTTSGSDSGLSDLFSSGADALVDAGAGSSLLDNINIGDFWGSMSPSYDMLDSVMEYAPTTDNYDLSNFLNTDGAGYDFSSPSYDTSGLDKLVSDIQMSEAPSISPAQLDGFNYPTDDLTAYLAPTSELANISDPVEQALKLQSASVYGMSPDTGDSYTTDYLTGATVPSGSAPAYMGTGSDSFNQYYDPQTGVVPTNAGIPVPSASWLTSLLKRPGPGKKSMLQSGLGTALMAAQIAGALRGNKGSNDDDAKDMVTAQQAEQKITQTPTTSMTWATPGTKRASGGPIYGRTRPTQGALGLLRGAQAGQEDGVPINASHGEYVFDADTVSALGDGNTEAGAKRLDEMRQRIRTHKRSAPATKIPPKAKPAASYLAGRK